MNKCYLLEFSSCCCDEIVRGVYPMVILKGEFDYATACQYLTDTYGHYITILSWKEIDEKDAKSVGRWNIHVNEMLGRGMGPRPTAHVAPKQKREEPATVKDNVIYPERWKKKDETDPTKPGPKGAG
jgi:hypothetical protein